MTWRGSFDEALNSAIDSLFSGEPARDVLARFPEHAAELWPLLETASAMSPGRGYEPPTDRLTAAESRIRAAATVARRDFQRSTPGRTEGPWWSRRVVFASLSMPAAVVAFVVLSAGSAAAATVALTTDLPAQIAEQVERVTPEWSHSVIPGGDDGASPSERGTGVPPEAAPEALDTASSGTATFEPSSTATTPAATSVSGIITDVRGNVFDLQTADGVYMVQMDAKTILDGVLVVGASATAGGPLTGHNRLHATMVSVTAPEATPSTPGGRAPATPPGQAEKTHTPPGQAETTHTPPGQVEQTRSPGPPEKTKTPGPPATPPGQGGGNGNGGGNGGGNGNGDGNEN